jgi:ATP10 protein
MEEIQMPQPPILLSKFRRVVRKRRAVIIGLIVALAVPLVGYADARSNRCSDRIEKPKSNDDFPSITAKTLAGRCVAFPKATRGKVGLVFVAFEQGAQSRIDTWVEPLVSGYLTNKDIAYYEIPMISGAYTPVSRLIDSGMRGGVPTDLHDRTATFYGDRAAFFSSMKIEDRSNAYLFVLSRTGQIVHRASGSSTAELVAEVRKAIEDELNSV